MSSPPNQLPPPLPSAKPKISAEERHRPHVDCIKTIRLRMAIGQELDDRSINDLAEIGAALGMPAAEEVSLRASSLFGMGGMRVPSLPGQLAPPTSGLFLCSAEKGRFFVPA